MKLNRLERPIFFVGSPRSGTTLIYEAFARHADLGWLSNYSRMLPEWPSLNLLRRLLDNRVVRLQGQKKQYAPLRLGNRFLPYPEEAYRFWDTLARSDFSKSYLLEASCSESARVDVRRALHRTLAWQGKPRLTTKFTGPLRIEYLTSLFPDAQFVHIIRDGRGVVRSLMEVAFWRKKGGMDAPFWNPGFPAESQAAWESAHRDPAVLAALQWRDIINLGREESAQLSNTQYLEVKYEDYLENPHDNLSKLYQFAGLDDAPGPHRYVSSLPIVRGTNDRFEEMFDEDRRLAISSVVNPLLSTLGYETD